MKANLINITDEDKLTMRTKCQLFDKYNPIKLMICRTFTDTNQELFYLYEIL